MNECVNNNWKNKLFPLRIHVYLWRVSVFGAEWFSISRNILVLHLPIKHFERTTTWQQPATGFHGIIPIHYIKPIFSDVHIKKQKRQSLFIIKLNLKQPLIVHVWEYILASVFNCQAVLFTYTPLHFYLLQSVYVEWTLRSGSRFITSQGIGRQLL